MLSASKFILPARPFRAHSTKLRARSEFRSSYFQNTPPDVQVSIREYVTFMIMQNKTRLIVWAIVVALILMIPLAMQFTNEVQWNEAVAYGVILLVVGGFYELWQWLKTRSNTYRFAFGAGLAGALLLGWVSGAVGIIGSENQPVNLM